MAHCYLVLWTIDSSEKLIWATTTYHTLAYIQWGCYKVLRHCQHDNHHQISSMSRTKPKNLNVKFFSSCLAAVFAQNHWSQALCREWSCSWSSADRRCSNYIWVINNFIAYEGAACIRALMVFAIPLPGVVYVYLTCINCIDKQSRASWVRTPLSSSCNALRSKQRWCYFAYDIYNCISLKEKLHFILRFTKIYFIIVRFTLSHISTYRKTSNIRRTLIGNKIFDH